jgi:hypothetical protein
MKQYYVLTSSPHLRAVFEFIRLHDLPHEIHFNRTRFWLDPNSPAFTEFALQWSDHCPRVESP